ncbi:hypothetical protein OIU77_021382 [Salix suchowensis]|uniref:Uncharacterized protein n=1 Tax=Salix suchowensis TaxID=1278906 RepID=A0ABQ9CDJ4_9ROSI|nr:hypothetical protein OIU77_021382 [Salix suchowensis]
MALCQKVSYLKNYHCGSETGTDKGRLQYVPTSEFYVQNKH